MLKDAEHLAAAARGGDAAAFEQIAARHRRELTAHCYRMLGSPLDAEDAVQEALLAAWRAMPSFEGRSSLRTWLYRISTNVCLRAASRRSARLLSSDAGPSRSASSELGDVVPGPVWLEPWPQDVVADEPGPDASYLRREGVELAFVAALQHLPATQRAVLILREVLEFSAAEVGAMLDTTPASVNSALQRARVAVRERVPATSQEVELDVLGDRGQRKLLDALVDAWQRADIQALQVLLTDDVRLNMPPLPAWFDGRSEVLAFFERRVFATPWRLVPTWANDQLALAGYQQHQAGGGFQLGLVDVLDLREGRIAGITAFLDPECLSRFQLPTTLKPVPQESSAEDR